jgi:ATP-binding cassette, subfamily B, bacterial
VSAPAVAARAVYTDRALIPRLFVELRPWWLRITAIFGVSLLATPLALLTPVPLKIVVDSVLGPHPLPSVLHPLIPDAAERSDQALLVFSALLFVGVAVLTQLQDLLSTMLRTSTGERLVLHVRSKLFEKAQALPLGYHDRVGTSDSAYRIQDDAKALQYLAVDTLVSLVTAAATFAAMIYVTARISGTLALVALTVSPVLILAARSFRRRLRTQARGVKKLESGALSVVQEVLGGLRVVKAFGQEHREHDRFVRRAGDGTRARIRLALTQGAYALLIGTTTGAGGAAVLYVGVNQVRRGTMTLGDLLLVMGYLSQLYAPLKTMAKKAGSLQSHLASAERVFGLLDEPSQTPERPDARRLPRARGAVAFSDVTFGYEPDRPVIHGVSFEAEPGARVGISGATGAGKTTLMGLLTRFYDPITGRILLDGIDLRDLAIRDLRSQFGIVLQEPVLFSTSIAENIAYARPDAREREIVAAAQAANAHEFISRLPDGYVTQVGDRGQRLSGGERQRIALARAFLKDAPILILDEPTSSVDVRTEAVIMEAMDRLMEGRTSFMIAHRLGTLRLCDTRLEIQSGRLTSPPIDAPPTAKPAPGALRA